LPVRYPVPKRQSSKRPAKGTTSTKPVSDESPHTSPFEPQQRIENIMMDIPHPNSYPVPRGRPGLHDIYVGKRKTKNKKADPPLIDAKKKKKKGEKVSRQNANAG
jgi:hypothetical protein